MIDQEGVHPQARALGDCLAKRSMLVATAESCTGGSLAGALTSVPGSSNWFDQGWVTYTNKAKVAQLGVAPQILRDFGAVSEQVARQMAAGALAMAPKAHLSLATTGIAGPGGGSADKPVGLVWFAFAKRVDDIVVVTACSQVFEGTRAQVRESSVRFSIEHALQLLQSDA
jgi:nicotinamide-nucleotide amidase